ncbi:hypothetical protein C1H46_005509 [Malus baccata]|uniref:Uncharacterized protein n=1 Tax=Malus baccata TaxID=106549 RepID=A0A540NCW9_MALBA|nr:hypothetical protein C1H46_005509 [Malus baccata]
MEVGGHKRGYLSSADIALVQGRVKVLVSPKIRLFPEYKQQFKELIIEVLGADTSDKPELASFYKWIDEHKISFEFLWMHPLIRSPKERLYMMAEGPLYLDKSFHRKHHEDWGDKYRELYTDVVLIEDVVKGVTGFEDVLYYKGDTWFKDKSEDPNERYEKNDLGVLKFARNAVIRINEHLAETGEKRMEE